MIVLLTVSLLQLSEAADKIWQNECQKDPQKLVFWNASEPFPSLGIGHFIWLPADSKAPFEETFPFLVKFLKQKGCAVPDWMQAACPWSTREDFLSALSRDQVSELKELLLTTLPLQTEFLLHRFELTEPQLIAYQSRIDRLKASSQGLYVLLDYLNFKGSGLSEKEQYQGFGWGLKQVLAEMAEKGSVEEAPAQFAQAAAVVLRRRIKNAPPEKGEERWLNGWLKRVLSYSSAG